MTRREQAITTNAIELFDSLRVLHTEDPVAAERIRRTIESELAALRAPRSITERAMGGGR